METLGVESVVCWLLESIRATSAACAAPDAQKAWFRLMQPAAASKSLCHCCWAACFVTGDKRCVLLTVCCRCRAGYALLYKGASTRRCHGYITPCIRIDSLKPDFIIKYFRTTTASSRSSVTWQLSTGQLQACPDYCCKVESSQITFILHNAISAYHVQIKSISV